MSRIVGYLKNKRIYMPLIILILLSTMGIFSLAKQKDTPIKEGDKVGDFTLNDENGKPFHFNDELGKNVLVIYFYPKDDTPGCTTEACSFRDSYNDFADLGARVIGISGDSEKSHLKFKEKHRLPFTLLSDKDNKVRDKIFGVPRDILGLLPGRVTYIIDKSGKVVKVYNSMSGSNHHTESLQAIKNLK